MNTSPSPQIAVIGGGPAGLIAAETLATAGLGVTVYDHMPTMGRKLMMAGRGGLNLTHSEPLELFLSRYSAPEMAALVAAFPPAALIAWCEGLGQSVFTGSSGRVFPTAMKASPLLRAWLARLTELGVVLRNRAEWQGWTEDGRLRFAEGEPVAADAVILALGGASWPRLGSTGAWAAWLPEGSVSALLPANCGFAVDWSEIFIRRFAGTPLKRIALRFGGRTVRGEAMVSAQGIEGGAVYALSAALRDALAQGPATLHIDLRPDLETDAVANRLDAPRGGVSLANHLRRAGLAPVAIGLVQEAMHRGAEGKLSELVKALPVRVQAPFGLAKAISTAGGVRWNALDGGLMLRTRPGVFVAGEMLDWEAPTGGYLLQGCFASGVAAAKSAISYVFGA